MEEMELNEMENENEVLEAEPVVEEETEGGFDPISGLIGAAGVLLTMGAVTLCKKVAASDVGQKVKNGVKNLFSKKEKPELSLVEGDGTEEKTEEDNAEK